MSKLSEETSDSLRAMKEKQTSLGVALSGVQAEVAMLMNPRTQTIFSQSKRYGQIFPKLTLNLKFTCQVKKLADMGGVTEDLGVISSKVRDAEKYQNR